MLPVKVFIACSGGAVPLAKALCDHLDEMSQDVRDNKHGLCPPVVWYPTRWWERTKGLGKPLISMLRDECLQANLAVTILTGDDLKLTRGTELQTPRDNCVFEAGLFMGALGGESERSVLISSVKDEARPGDLSGVKYLKLDEELTPERLKDAEWCKRSTEELARDLAKHAWSELREPPKRPVLPVISADELFARERPTREGGDLDLDGQHAVVVNTVQPAEESNIQRARQVVENINAGVKYLYFFRADTDHVPKVIALLESLIIAMLTRKATASYPERQSILRDNLSKIPEKLEQIQPGLFIHFLPNDRAPLLFCVHNAGNVGKARCYLRDGAHERFYVWGNAETAFNVASDLGRYRVRQLDPAIFYPTGLFKLYGREGRDLRYVLARSLEASFGDSDKIQDLCFLDSKSVKLLLRRGERVPDKGSPGTPPEASPRV